MLAVERAPYVRQEKGLEVCPSCGSGRLICLLGVDLDGCCECLRFWERLPAGEPYLVDGEQLPFKTPCDNCAFRGKSPERLDGDRWEGLMLSLAHGGEFYCHKGVPFKVAFDEAGKVARGEQATIEKEFEYPKVPCTAGQTTIRYNGYDRDRMRLCRGFLNQFWSK